MVLEDYLVDFSDAKQELRMAGWFEGALINHLRLLSVAGLFKANDEEIKACVRRYLAKDENIQRYG